MILISTPGNRNKVLEHDIQGSINSFVLNPNLCIIFIHGYFSANRIGPNRLFVESEQELLRLGCATIRFDWAGMGESDGHLNKISFEDTVGNISSIIKLCGNLFPNVPILIVAHSVGCFVTIDYLLKSRNRYNNTIGITFLAPGPFGSKSVEALKLNFKQEQYERKGLLLNRTFVDKLIRTEWYSEIEKLDIHTLIICNLDDEFCSVDLLNGIDSRRLIKKYFNTGGHNFTSLEAKEGTIGLITEFVKGIIAHEI